VNAARSLALLPLVAVVLVGASLLVIELGSRPIASVRVAGDFRHVTRAALEAAVAPALGTGFFRVNVNAVRRAALALPWAKDVSVRRVWPDSVHIALVERDAEARWVGGGLIDADGALFHPETVPADLELPRLAGPAGSHADALARYRVLAAALAPLGAGIRSLALDRRAAWEAELTGGTRLVLGRHASPERLQRFARAFSAALGGRLGEVERVDLRYTHGFAVRLAREARDESAMRSGEMRGRATHDEGEG